ncbi:MAG: dienelactone hydrolase family protein [Alphaproteobacteria bacterium]|nr:dienelactone hydrolase family protein [Alphaproteobacteria bacterium]
MAAEVDSKPETVHFTSADEPATPLSGLLVKPKGKGPHSAVIMLHGCSGMLTKSGKLKQRPTFWSRWLAARGHLVLMADSFTPRGLNSICKIKKRPVQPDRERPFDAYGALKYLQSRPDVRPDRIALMGWSNGAMTLLWTVKAETPARPAGLTHDFRAAIAFYPGCVKLAKTDYRAKTPVLLQLGEADDWTPAKPCLDLMASAIPKGSPMRADVYPNAYHNFDHPTSKLKIITTRNSVYKGGEKQVHVGSNPEARAAAIANVAAYLERFFR